MFSYFAQVGALNTFWRGAENFETRASFLWTDVTGMLWAVSQAAPLRRVVVTENLKLYQYRQGDPAAGYASGGCVRVLFCCDERFYITGWFGFYGCVRCIAHRASCVCACMM